MLHVLDSGREIFRRECVAVSDSSSLQLLWRTEPPHQCEVSLPVQQRRQAYLGLMYKITGGLIPAIPPQNYLTPVSASRRRIRPTKYEDFEATNIIDCHEVRNTRGFHLPAYNTKQYQNSLFVWTVVEWNHLEENIVKAGSASAFTSALSRSTLPAS